MRRFSFSEAEEFLTKMEAREHTICGTKGKEYGLDYRTSNFRRLGEEIKTSCPKCGCHYSVGPYVILWIFLKKHLDAILSFINGRRAGLSEAISERIHDARVYEFLLQCLIDEDLYEEEVELPDIQKKIKESGD